MTFIEIQEFIEQLVATSKAEVLTASTVPPHSPTYPSEALSDLLYDKIQVGFDTVKTSDGITGAVMRGYDLCRRQGLIIIIMRHVSLGVGPGQPEGDPIEQRYRLEVVDEFYPESR